MGKLKDVLTHPDELVPLVSIALAARRAKVLPKQPGLAFCYDMLNRVSRSFAIVIQQLPEGLRDAVCVFYLVLRALDTVEDDMALELGVKVPLLRCFHEKSYDRSWSMSCGTGEYVRLMEQYPLVTDVFLGLDAAYQQVIADICRKMGAGMADFAESGAPGAAAASPSKAKGRGRAKPKAAAARDGEAGEEAVESIADYNLYCHYVAGLVGIGLSQLFASSGLESPAFLRCEALANEMGLFLQKTNIIRDYLEDINEEPRPRMWWPREIWGRYASSLADLKQPEHAAAAVQCVNHMVTDALSLVGSCLDYMERLQDPAIFRFCAIPQIMAIATLSLCYNNHTVFTGVVKMRRGEVAKVMYHLKDFGDVCALFRSYAHRLRVKAQRDAVGDPNQAATVALCTQIIATCSQRLDARLEAKAAAELADRRTPVPLPNRIMVLCMAALYVAYARHIEEVRRYLGVTAPASAAQGLDRFNLIAALAFMVYALVMLVTGRKI